MDLFETKNISPMLIGHNQPAFDDPDFIFELKFDGVRGLAYLDGNGADLRNKRNKIVTAIYPELQNIHGQVKERCILDGEIFVLQDGKTDFYEMQRRALMTNPFKIQLAAAKLPVSFVAFDILYLGTERVTHLPLMERKALLAQTVEESERLAISRYIDGKGTDLYAAAEAQGLEGVVGKRKESHYFIGKTTKDWIKCKNLMHDDFVVCGYFMKGHLASAACGAYGARGELFYQTHVLLGTSRPDFRMMANSPRVDKERYYSSFPDYPGAVWIEPQLVCTVEYMQRTAGGGLRQPAFRGLRDDKSPEECILT